MRAVLLSLMSLYAISSFAKVVVNTPCPQNASLGSYVTHFDAVSKGVRITGHYVDENGGHWAVNGTWSGEDFSYDLGDEALDVLFQAEMHGSTLVDAKINGSHASCFYHTPSQYQLKLWR